MYEEILLNKSATVEWCVRRAYEEYEKASAAFHASVTHQDAAILNIQRACGAVLEIAKYLQHREFPEAKQPTVDALALLSNSGHVEPSILTSLKVTLSFCDAAIRNCEGLEPRALEEIIIQHLHALVKCKNEMMKLNAKYQSQPLSLS